jgi:hypothetical protein
MINDSVREGKIEYCFLCGVNPVPYKGWRCRPCRDAEKQDPLRHLIKIVLILTMTALLTLAARWAFAVRGMISAESIGASHSE